MKISKDIRSMLGQLRFVKEMRKVKTKREVVGFDTAGKIGILYDATDERDYETIRNYVKQVRSQFKKDVMALGYVDKNGLPKTQYAQFGLDFFTRKDLDFRMIPTVPVVKNFMSEKFDILINLNSKKCFPLQYISALSKARFRVGRFDRQNMMCFDMMIQINGNPGIRTVIEEFETYLRQIRTSHESQ